MSPLGNLILQLPVSLCKLAISFFELREDSAPGDQDKSDNEGNEDTYATIGQVLGRPVCSGPDVDNEEREERAQETNGEKIGVVLGLPKYKERNCVKKPYCDTERCDEVYDEYRSYKESDDENALPESHLASIITIPADSR